MIAALSQAPSRRGAHSAWIAVLAMLAALLLLAWPGEAKAQNVTIDKTLCDATITPLACDLNAVSPGQPVYYQLTINSTGGIPGPVDVKDNLPPGFIVSGAACGPVGGPMTAVNPTPVAPLATLPLPSLPAGGAVCTISGSFGAGALAAVVNRANLIDHATEALLTPFEGTHPHAVELVGPLPSDLGITKTADMSSIDISPSSPGPHFVTYTIRVKNHGANHLYLGTLLEIQDRLALNSNGVALNVRLVSASCTVNVHPANATSLPPSDCLSTTPVQPYSVTPLVVGYNAPHDFAAWRYPATGPGSAGLLRVGDEIVLTVVVEVTPVADLHCVVTPGADGFVQSAHIVLTLGPGGTTLADLDPSNNTAGVPLQVITGETTVDPDCNAPFKPKLKIVKVQTSPAPASGVPWNPTSTTGPTVDYMLTVQNISATHRIRNIQLVDRTGEAIGTPPFLATPDSETCLPADCTPAPPVLTAQQLPGYGIEMDVLGTVMFGPPSSGLAPFGSAGDSASFTLRMRYSDPKCDSIQDGALDPIVNHMRVASWEEVDINSLAVKTVTIPLDAYVVTNMEEAQPCPLLVTKGPADTGPFAPKTITFNTPYSYVVTFENPTAASYTVGTLIDTLRFSPPASGGQPYAISLKVDYGYVCNSTGPGTITGHPTAQTGIAHIVGNALPQQGVRLIQNAGPVTFGGNSKLVCTVTVTVRPPAPTDPYCWTATLDNAAILDMSAYYNPNLPWTTNPGNTNMWATVSNALPPCFNWTVSKKVKPGWTWPGGPAPLGQLDWTYSIYNAGPPMATGGPIIHDQFLDQTLAPLGVTVTAASYDCVNPNPCTAPLPIWLVNPTTAPPGAQSVLVPYVLAHKQSLETKLTVPNVPAGLVHGDLACNQVSVSLPNLGGSGAYWKNPDPKTRTATACARILDIASIDITKIVTNSSGIPIPSTNTYAITVSCSYPTDPNVIIPSTNLTLAAGATGTVTHIPVGSQCSATEPVPPPVPPGTATCAWPIWQIYTTPLSPFGIPLSSANGTVKVSLTNHLTCRPVASIVIAKTTIVPPGMSTPVSFPFTVSCSFLGPNSTVAVPANGQVTIPNVPIVNTCTLTEQFPPPPPGCSWTASPNPIPALTIAVPNGTTTVKVTNRLVCTGRIVVNKTTSVPLGIPLPASILFNLNCIPGGAFTITAPANGPSPPLTVPAPSTCIVTEQIPPAPAGCAWNVAPNPSSVVVAPGGSVVASVTNKLICKPGRLVIRKKTAVPPGVAMPASFQFNVNCTPGGPNIPVNVPANSTSPFIAVPAPASCTVTEVVPPPPAGCSWNVVQSPSGAVAVPPGATVLVSVRNKLVCTGRIVVRKKTVVPPGVPLPASILFNVNCTPGGAFTITAPANNLSPPLTVPAPSTCTVTEQVPPAPPGCAWNVVKSPPGNVVVAPGATVIVSFGNTLTCKPGRLIIRKKTSVPPGKPMPASFLFNVNCSPGVPTTVTVPANGLSAPVIVAAPTSCTVTEQVPPPPPGCSWTVSQSPTGPIAVAPGATVLVNVSNKLVCNLPGQLVIKKVTNHPVPQTPFTFSVNCTPNGPNTTITVASTGSAVLGNIPTPANCTIVEQPHSAPPGCTWVATYAPPSPVTIPSGATVTVTATNKLVCNPPGELIIRKVTIPSPIASMFASIPIDVDCNPGGPHNSMTLPANGQVSVGSIAGGSSCAVTEHLPALANPSCQWVGTASPSNPVTVPAGATVTMTLTNKVVCSQPGRLIIQKATTGPPGVPLPASILFNVNCTPGGPSTITAPTNGFSPALAVSAPATCTMAEQVPPAPAGCTWSASQSPPGNAAVAAGAVVVVTVFNKLVCTPAGGATLIVRKSTVFPPGATPFASVTVNVSCTPGGPNTTITVPANGQTAINNIPVPATCVVNEQVPPSSVPGCGWSVTKVPAGTNALASAGATGTASLTNSWSCALPAPSEILVIRKFVVTRDNPQGRLPGELPPILQGTFPITVTCGSNPPTSGELGPANQWQMMMEVPAGADLCQVREALPPFPDRACRWVGWDQQGGSAMIRRGEQNIFVLFNESVCN